MAASDLQLEMAQTSPLWAVRPIALFSQSKKVRHQGTAFCFVLFFFTASNIYLLSSLCASFLSQYLIHIISFDPHRDRKSKVQYLGEVIIFYVD